MQAGREKELRAVVWEETVITEESREREVTRGYCKGPFFKGMAGAYGADDLTSVGQAILSGLRFCF